MTGVGGIMGASINLGVGSGCRLCESLQEVLQCKLPHTGGLHERKPLLQGLIGILEVAMSTIPNVYAGPTRIVGRNNDSGLRLIRISASHAWSHHI